MKTNLLALLDTALEGRHLLDHPFYRRWEAGELVDGELRSYAEQYRFFEANLPLVLAELAERLPEGPAYRAVLDNLRDETAAPSHLELFEGFASAYGATDASISPAMERLVATYHELLAEGDVAALAGVLAYELQGADIAASKSDGLRTHYAAPESALRFWDAHTSLENDHAAWTVDGLASLHGDDALIVASARRVADAWWDFLTERDELVAA